MIIQGLRAGISPDIRGLEIMTIYEYGILLKVAQLKKLDRLRETVDQIFIQRKADATTGTGKNQKYKFTTPEEIIDFGALEQQIRGEKKDPVFLRLKKIARNLQEYNRKEG